MLLRFFCKLADDNLIHLKILHSIKTILSAVIFSYFSMYNTSAQISFFKNYTVNDGLPSSVIYDITQDSLGYLWIATDYGISRYDGYTFKNFTTNDGIPANSNILIFEGKGNTLWFLTYSGQLSYTINSELQSFELNDTIPIMSDIHYVRTISVDKKNNVWFRYGKDTNYSVRISDNLDTQILDTFIPRRENFSFLFRDYCKPNHATVKESQKTIPVTTHNKVYRIRGNYYYLDSKNKLIFAGNKIRNANNTNFDETDTYSEENGTIWLRKKWDGVYVYNIKYLNQEPLRLLPDIRVTKVLKDMHGNYWIATEGSGLYYLPSVSFYVYDKTQGLHNANIISLEVNENTLFFATNDGKIYKGTLNKLAHLKISKELLGDEFKYPRDILYHSQGNLWIITSKYLRYTPEGSPLPLKYRVIKKSYEFHECNNQDVLVAMIEGFTRYDKNKLIYDSRTDGFIKHVRAIHEDKNGTVWLGAMDGLYSFNGKDYKFWGDSISTLQNRITAICGQNDEAWIGTRANGIVIVNPDTIRYINKQNGLSGNMIRVIYAKCDNEIWVGTTNGLNKILIHQDENSSQPEITNYTIWDGLPSNEINDIKSFNNYLVLATNLGLCTFNPADIKKTSLPPPLHIKNLSVNNTKVPTKEPIIIGDTANSILIKYLGISFNDPGNVTYCYKIKWEDKNHSPFSVKFRETPGWVETNNTSLQINAIPGKYTIMLKAAGHFKNWTHQPIALNFEVKKPFNQQLWFHILILIVVILLVSLFFLLIMRNRQRKQKTKTELLLSEQKALRSQMNPHFIFNSLNSIQNFILERDDEKTDLYLANFSSLMRKVLENSKHNLIPLSEEIETLEMYLQIEHLRFENKFSFKIILDKEIDPESVKIPPSLIQPYLENAIWHGLMPKQSAGKLKLEFKKQNKTQLLIIIEDDGIGREAALKLRNKSKDHKSTGMKNIDERLQLLNKYNKGEFYVRITDLKNDEGNAGGTRIELHIPFL